MDVVMSMKAHSHRVEPSDIQDKEGNVIFAAWLGYLVRFLPNPLETARISSCFHIRYLRLRQDLIRSNIDSRIG